MVVPASRARVPRLHAQVSCPSHVRSAPIYGVCFRSWRLCCLLPTQYDSAAIFRGSTAVYQGGAAILEAWLPFPAAVLTFPAAVLTFPAAARRLQWVRVQIMATTVLAQCQVRGLLSLPPSFSPSLLPSFLPYFVAECPT
eukprot:2469643-Rhodomonas_salina.2